MNLSTYLIFHDSIGANNRTYFHLKILGEGFEDIEEENKYCTKVFERKRERDRSPCILIHNMKLFVKLV